MSKIINWPGGRGSVGPPTLPPDGGDRDMEDRVNLLEHDIRALSEKVDGVREDTLFLKGRMEDMPTKSWFHSELRVQFQDHREQEQNFRSELRNELNAQREKSRDEQNATRNMLLLAFTALGVLIAALQIFL